MSEVKVERFFIACDGCGRSCCGELHETAKEAEICAVNNDFGIYMPAIDAPTVYLCCRCRYDSRLVDRARAGEVGPWPHAPWHQP